MQMRNASLKPTTGKRRRLLSVLLPCLMLLSRGSGAVASHRRSAPSPCPNHVACVSSSSSESSSMGIVQSRLQSIAQTKIPSFRPSRRVVANTNTITNTGVDVEGELRESWSDFMHHFRGPKQDTITLLFATAMIIPLFKRLNTSPILGFLLVGTVLGPAGLSLVKDVKITEALAELGIVFFLFEMGLELSLDKLVKMKKDVFGLGMAQFLVTTAIFSVVSLALRVPGPASLVIGASLALSSSAFVLQLLRDQDALSTRHGRASFGILLFQDLAVVPVLVMVPLLASGGTGLFRALLVAGVKALVTLSTITVLGRLLLDKIFYIVAKSKSQEAFLAVILLTVLAMSFVTEGFGLSNTLGAFLAGVLLSETRYRYQIEADIAPFRGLLLGLFFMTVGFSIDLSLVTQQLPLVAAMLSGLLAVKSAIITILCLGFGMSFANAQHSGLLLAQGGEFAFVALNLAEKLKIVSPSLSKLLLTTIALSMAATPLMGDIASYVADKMESKSGFSHYVGKDSDAQELKENKQDFVVVCGYGRIGKLVCEILDKKLIRYIVFDVNPQKAIEARNKGLPVFYGDVSRPEVLRSFNVGAAKAVVVCIDDVKSTNKAVITLRRNYPDLPIFARAKDIAHQERLQNTLDVSAMSPVMPEDSLLLTLPFGGAVLRKMGVPNEEITAILEDMRRRFLRDKGLDNDEESISFFRELGIGLQLPTFDSESNPNPNPNPNPSTMEVAAAVEH